MFRILTRVQSIVKRGLQAVSSAISGVTKPPTHNPALRTVTDLARSKPQLLAENLLLRQVGRRDVFQHPTPQWNRACDVNRTRFGRVYAVPLAPHAGLATGWLRSCAEAHA